MEVLIEYSKLFCVFNVIPYFYSDRIEYLRLNEYNYECKV